MKKPTVYTRSIAQSILFSLVFSTISQCYNQDFINHVANSNLNTFEVIEKQEEESAKPLNQQGFTDLVNALFTKHQFKIKKLTERDKREIAFKETLRISTDDESVIDTTFVNKMELVHGEAKPQDHLLYRMTNSQDAAGKFTALLATEFGKKRCIEMLTQPTTDIAVLSQRQAIIKELVANEELLNTCDTILQKIKSSEPLLLDLYAYKEIPEAEKILFFSKFFDSLGANKNTTALSISTRFGQVMNFLTNIGTAAYSWYVPRLVLAKENNTVKLIGNAFFGTCFFTPLLLIATSAQKQLINIAKDMQQKLIGAATYINGIQQLYKTAGSNQILKAHMPSLKKIASLLPLNPDDHSQDFKQLTALLRKTTFQKGNPSFFSSPGNILAAYKLMINEDTRKEFADAFNVLGELDTYVALAKKIKSSQNDPLGYAFVEFIQDEKPYVKAEEFWNPFIDPQNAVANTIELGTDNFRNIILTGPNTGGKSTLMKALTINMLLAQTFGIAPAKQLIMTPFANLSCHMNITDDTAGGVSLFKAEVNRAKELANLLKSLPRDQFMFIIIDELFTGTAPDKAEDLSMQFIKQLSEYHNCIFINATHFKKLTELEQATDVCKNFHMGVIADENGQVQKYTYKVEAGPSKINNAAQIAKEEEVIW